MRTRNDDFKKSFCWRSYIIFVFVKIYVAFCDLLQGLKTVMDLEARTEDGCGK